MKFLKKASLAASIAAVSFAANAELVAMDEMSMAAATGQAGIDLDITLAYETDSNGDAIAAISVGEILYTDTLEGGVGEIGGGSIAISNVTLTSATGEAVVLKNKIDIDSTGDIIIDSTETNASLVLGIGGIETRGTAGQTANLLGQTDIYMTLKGGTTVISQVADDADTADVNESATTIATTGGSIQITSELGNETNITALNGAIGLEGVEAYRLDDAGNKVGMSTDHTLTFNGNGVGITDLDLQGTIEIAKVKLGGSNIGSLAISNIQLNSATIQISGH
jgi:hypothetical protein